MSKVLSTLKLRIKAGSTCPECSAAKLKSKKEGKHTKTFCPKCGFFFLTAPARFNPRVHKDVTQFLSDLDKADRQARRVTIHAGGPNCWCRRKHA